MAKNKNPIWDYKYNHDLYIVKDIMNKVLTISIYGKYSPEDFEDMYWELGLLVSWSNFNDWEKKNKSTSKSTNWTGNVFEEEMKSGPNIYEETKKHLLQP